MRQKIIKTSTVSESLNSLLNGQLRFLDKYYKVIALSAGLERLKELKDREGVDIYEIKMERRISILKDIKSLFQLYLHLKKEKPLIIHSITPKAGLLSMMAGKMAGTPIRIHTFTGLIFPTRSGMMQKLLIKMDKLLCWAATNVYPEGNGVKNDLIHYKITSKPLRVLAKGNVNGINSAFFKSEEISNDEQNLLKEQLGIEVEDFVFVFVGRLVGDKGINELVKAFSSLNRTNIKLLLVGSLEAELDSLKKQTLDKIEQNTNIISVGFQSDVRPYFAISDCLVFPSYREGFPNVVIQAGAMGLPSIVTDINGCNEIIIEGENGTIIPVKNIEAIIKAMQNIMDDKQYFQHLKSNAREMITSRYEQKVVWEALLAEYKSLESSHSSKK